MTFLMRTDKHRIPISLATALSLVLLCASTVWGGQVDNLERRIKAAYLYNFTKFIQWPQGELISAKTPFTLAVIGPDRYDKALAPLEQKRVKDRPLRIIRLDSDTPLPPAIDILFVTSKNPREIKQVLAKAKAKPILTIGDAAAFIQSGGLINFYLAGNKIRFEINARAAQAKGFRISSQLLKLARIVQGGGP
jgi:hypothetical protein